MPKNKVYGARRFLKQIFDPKLFVPNIGVGVHRRAPPQDSRRMPVVCRPPAIETDWTKSHQISFDPIRLSQITLTPIKSELSIT